MLVGVVLFVLFGEWVLATIGRYSTDAIPHSQPVSHVSSMRHTNNIYVSGCSMQQSHCELLAPCKQPP